MGSLNDIKFTFDKDRLETILQGGVPDHPPHIEIVFQLESEIFGIDFTEVENKNYTTSSLKADAIEKCYADIQNRLIDEFDYAAVPGLFYQPDVDPHGYMDIKAVREQYPGWILMGNVNCSMLQDTEEDKIRESVRYCMKYGGSGRRYIFSTSNCIFKGMPVESYEIMLDEYRDLCNI